MADNKGSSSNPTKVLVSHLDRNRTLQQDRVVASSSTPAIFRSQPPSRSAASVEANFNNFANGANRASALPLRPAIPQVPQSHAELERVGRIWLAEFSQLRESQVQDPRIMVFPARAADQAAANQGGSNLDAATRVDAYRAAAAARASVVNGPGVHHGGVHHGGVHHGGGFTHGPGVNHAGVHHGGGFPRGSTMLSQIVSRPGGFHDAANNLVTGVQSAGDARIMAEYGQFVGRYHERMEQFADVIIPATEQYNIYPEQVLADNPGHAMEAAFDAYDMKFQDEMDKWMATHGPKDREDHFQIMKETLAMDAVDDAMHGNVINKTQMGPSLNPDIPGSNIETYEKDLELYNEGIYPEYSPEKPAKKTAREPKPLDQDAELKKHAAQILSTTGSEGSPATKEKLKASTFIGLMEAIADDTPSAENKTQNEGKGKGKMETLEEQAEY